MSIEEMRKGFEKRYKCKYYEKPLMYHDYLQTLQFLKEEEMNIFNRLRRKNGKG